MRGLLAENGIDGRRGSERRARSARPVRGRGTLRAARARRPTPTRPARSSQATSPRWPPMPDERVRSSIAWPSATTSCGPTTTPGGSSSSVTGSAGLAGGDAPARRRLRHRPARDRRRRALRRAGLGRRQLEGDDRPRPLARVRVGSRSASPPPTRCRSATDGSTPSSCGSWCTRSAPRARRRVPRGGSGARARRAALHLDVRARRTSRASTSRRTCRACRRWISRASRIPTSSPAELRAAGFADVDASRRSSQDGSVSRAEAAERVRGRLHLDRAPPAARRGRRLQSLGSRRRRRRASPISRRDSTGA